MPRITKKASPEPPPAPRVGDRVMLGSSDTVYIVARASSDGKDVDLNLPGTNIERFRVPSGDLKFVELSARAPSKPARPSINVEEIRERLDTARHKRRTRYIFRYSSLCRVSESLSNLLRLLEHRMGFEPMNTGFADQRVSHFAIGALSLKACPGSSSITERACPSSPPREQARHSFHSTYFGCAAVRMYGFTVLNPGKS